jgi:hypothetical protein
METTLNDLLRNNRSWPFRLPVDANDVPDYYDVIKNPMGDVFLQSLTPYFAPLTFFLQTLEQWRKN